MFEETRAGVQNVIRQDSNLRVPAWSSRSISFSCVPTKSCNGWNPRTPYRKQWPGSHNSVRENMSFSAKRPGTSSRSAYHPGANRSPLPRHPSQVESGQQFPVNPLCDAFRYPKSPLPSTHFTLPLLNYARLITKESTDCFCVHAHIRAISAGVKCLSVFELALRSPFPLFR